MIGIEIAGFASSYAKKFISRAQLQAVLIIANLCIAVVGLQGAITSKNNVLLIVSCVLGAMIGVKLNLDGKFNQLGLFLKSKF
ncbi:MAG: DUF554 family protein, partial [Turicibacter sp.]|nr:DUF554 family protein [Turicibacter sp.]